MCEYSGIFTEFFVHIFSVFFKSFTCCFFFCTALSFFYTGVSEKTKHEKKSFRMFEFIIRTNKSAICINNLFRLNVYNKKWQGRKRIGWDVDWKFGFAANLVFSVLYFPGFVEANQFECYWFLLFYHCMDQYSRDWLKWHYSFANLSIGKHSNSKPAQFNPKSNNNTKLLLFKNSEWFMLRYLALNNEV